MELETVAEYVETAEARDLITKLGVDCAQGFAISEPLALGDVLADLTGDAQSSAG